MAQPFEAQPFEAQPFEAQPLGADPSPLDELREIVRRTPPAPEALDAYLEKVRLHAHRVTDADVEGLKAAGLSEDEIFEQTVAAAIGQGLRRLDAAERAIG